MADETTPTTTDPNAAPATEPAAADPANAPATEPAAPPPPPPPVAEPGKTHQVKEFKHSRPFFSCRIDPAGKFICAGAQDYLVQRFELASDQKVEFTGHQSWVRGMNFPANSDLLVAGDYAGKMCGWRYAADPAQALAWSVDAHQGWVRAVVSSPDGATLATTGNDRLIKLWSTADGKPLRELAGHESHVYHCAFHPSTQHLASADLKGVVKDWDLASGTAVRQMDAAVLWKYDPSFCADIGGARGMAFSPDGKWLAVSGITDVSNAFAGIGNPLVVVLDWETGTQKTLLRPKEPFQGVAWSVAFHPAGFVIGVGGGGGGGALWFWNPEQAEPIFEMKLPNHGRDVAIHPDGLHLAIAHADNMVRLYKMSDAA